MGPVLASGIPLWFVVVFAVLAVAASSSPGSSLGFVLHQFWIAVVIFAAIVYTWRRFSRAAG